MAENTIQIEVEFEDGKKGFAHLKSESKKAGEESGDAFGSAFMPGLKAALKVAGAVAGVVGAIFSKESIDAAIEQENAINRFNQALARSGQFSQQFTEDFQDYVGSLQASTKFTDEAILSNAALLQTMGRLTQEQLKPATQAAIDLASAYGIGLEQAFEIVGKAANGQTMSLKKLGIEVTKGATDAQTFANALALIQQRIGGAATSEVNSFAGAVALASNAFGEILESVGNFIVKSPAVIGIIKGIGDVFNNIASAISKNNSIDSFITSGANALIVIANAVNDYLIKPIVLFGEIGNAVFQSVLGGLTVINQAFGLIYFSITKILSKVGVVSEEAAAIAGQNLDSLTNKVTEQANNTKKAFEDIGTSTFGEAIGNQIRTVDLALQQSLVSKSNLSLLDNQEIINVREKNAEYEKLIQNLLGVGFAMEELRNKSLTELKAIESSVTQVATAFKSALVSGISNGVQTMVKSMAAGKFSFQAFGNMILGIIGNMAIQIGTTLVGIGIGIEALKTSLLGLTGGPAIAAGIALIAIGALLTSLSSGGAETANVQPGGGVASGGGVAAVAPTEVAGEQERQAPKTQVVVNVEGNVFNGREQAQFIAENLQEYFDTNNGLLVRT